MQDYVINVYAVTFEDEHHRLISSVLQFYLGQILVLEYTFETPILFCTVMNLEKERRINVKSSLPISSSHLVACDKDGRGHVWLIEEIIAQIKKTPPSPRNENKVESIQEDVVDDQLLATPSVGLSKYLDKRPLGEEMPQHKENEVPVYSDDDHDEDIYSDVMSTISEISTLSGPREPRLIPKPTSLEPSTETHSSANTKPLGPLPLDLDDEITPEPTQSPIISPEPTPVPRSVPQAIEKPTKAPRLIRHVSPVVKTQTPFNLNTHTNPQPEIIEEVKETITVEEPTFEDVVISKPPKRQNTKKKEVVVQREIDAVLQPIEQHVESLPLTVMDHVPNSSKRIEQNILRKQAEQFNEEAARQVIQDDKMLLFSKTEAEKVLNHAPNESLFKGVSKPVQEETTEVFETKVRKQVNKKYLKDAKERPSLMDLYNKDEWEKEITLQTSGTRTIYSICVDQYEKPATYSKTENHFISKYLKQNPII